jgi:hypothetical protein
MVFAPHPGKRTSSGKATATALVLLRRHGYPIPQTLWALDLNQPSIAEDCGSYVKGLRASVGEVPFSSFIGLILK